MTELNKPREYTALFSSDDNDSLTDYVQVNSFEDRLSSDGLRQRQITTSDLNDPYDLLEQDLIYLREAVDEVAALLAQQQQTLSRLDQLKYAAEYRMRDMSSIFHNAIQNPYFAYASGAVVGATVSGPVGFLMGTKLGALLTLSGSAVGALTMNTMRQKHIETDELQSNTTKTYSQAML